MTLRTTLLIGSLLLASAGLMGCGDRHVDRGPTVTENRDVGEFDSIAVRGAARIVVRVGTTQSVTVEGPEKSVKSLTTEVDGDTLYIRSSRKDFVFSSSGSRLVVNVTLPSLDELHLEGSNDARLSGFNGGKSRIEIEGAANVEARGRLDELTVHMQGAGRANLRELVATEAKVTVDGVGTVHVNSTGSLDATMNGVGAILYSGAPREVNTSMNGVGTISKDRKSQGSDTDEGDWDTEKQQEAKPVDPDSLQPEYEKEEVEKREVSVETAKVV
jgi:hypothetical protein